jgi:hypothetical protein
MDEPGWLTFYTAARQVEQRRAVSQAGAQAMLRQACRDEKMRSMKAPYEGEQDQLPFELWTRLAPRDWRERDVDYDGPDADGCWTIVMINEADFLRWLDQEAAANPEKSLGGLQPLLIRLLSEKFPGKPVPDRFEYKREALLEEMKKKHKRLTKLDHATLKIAIDSYNSTF